MAAYAASVSIEHVFGAIGHKKIATGTVDVTNYNQTNAEITGITGMFSNGRPPAKLILTGISDNGYCGRYDATNGTIVCYYINEAKDGDAEAAAAAVEVDNDVDVGVFDFIAIG